MFVIGHLVCKMSERKSFNFNNGSRLGLTYKSVSDICLLEIRKDFCCCCFIGAVNILSKYYIHIHVHELLKEIPSRKMSNNVNKCKCRSLIADKNIKNESFVIAMHSHVK